jgi:hypothetical protein
MCLKLSLLVKNLSKQQSEMLGDFFEMLFDRIDSIEDQWSQKIQVMAECIDDAGFCKNCTCKQCTNKQTKPSSKISPPVEWVRCHHFQETTHRFNRRS